LIENKVAFSEKQNKRAGWTRMLDVVLRAAHVLVISLLFGGVFFKIPLTQLLLWRYFVIGSGCALIASEVFHSRHWPYQGRGVMVFLHVGLFGLVYLRPDLATACLMAALVVGMAGSHMPKRLRHWSFLHRRVID
jgi:uncharacterized membrane protein HdeD (DUF308 family)